MSREIKFRAWVPATKTMVDLKKVTPLAMNKGLVEIGQDGLFLPFDDRYILMQYTGLTDRNGVEIYEGDVVDHEYTDGIWAVFYWEGCFTLKPYRDMALVNFNCPASMEVIGNIYEHGHLLNP